jgi:hypothetical protein
MGQEAEAHRKEKWSSPRAAKGNSVSAPTCNWRDIGGPTAAKAPIRLYEPDSALASTSFQTSSGIESSDWLKEISGPVSPVAEAAVALEPRPLLPTPELRSTTPALVPAPLLTSLLLDVRWRLESEPPPTTCWSQTFCHDGDFEGWEGGVGCCSGVNLRKCGWAD